VTITGPLVERIAEAIRTAEECPEHTRGRAHEILDRTCPDCLRLAAEAAVKILPADDAARLKGTMYFSAPPAIAMAKPTRHTRRDLEAENSRLNAELMRERSNRGR
jgi:hypothetical protein